MMYVSRKFWILKKGVRNHDIFELKPKEICSLLLVFRDSLTLIKLVMLLLWKKFQDEILHQRTFTKKTPNLVWAPFGRYQDIRQNSEGTQWSSIITTYLKKKLSLIY